MNYYEHHLGDYLRHTAHLSMLEDGAYRRLIDAYYIREAPLPNELREVFRLVRAQSKQDREAVETVLREFFTESPEGWRHGRCEHEIERFRSKSEKARASIRSRWERARNSEAAEERTDNERNTNVSSGGYERSTDDIHRAPVPTPQTPDTTLVPKVQREAGAVPAQAPPPPPAAPGPFSGESDIERLNGRHVVELSPTWELPTAWGIDAEALGWKPPDVLRESERFRQYWATGKGAGTRRGVKGWRQAWSNWLAKAERMAR